MLIRRPKKVNEAFVHQTEEETGNDIIQRYDRALDKEIPLKEFFERFIDYLRTNTDKFDEYEGELALNTPFDIVKNKRGDNRVRYMVRVDDNGNGFIKFFRFIKIKDVDGVEQCARVEVQVHHSLSHKLEWEDAVQIGVEVRILEDLTFSCHGFVKFVDGQAVFADIKRGNYSYENRITRTSYKLVYFISDFVETFFSKTKELSSLCLWSNSLNKTKFGCVEQWGQRQSAKRQRYISSGEYEKDKNKMDALLDLITKKFHLKRQNVFYHPFKLTCDVFSTVFRNQKNVLFESFVHQTQEQTEADTTQEYKNKVYLEVDDCFSILENRFFNTTGWERLDFKDFVEFDQDYMNAYAVENFEYDVPVMGSITHGIRKNRAREANIYFGYNNVPFNMYGERHYFRIEFEFRGHCLYSVKSGFRENGKNVPCFIAFSFTTAKEEDLKFKLSDDAYKSELRDAFYYPATIEVLSKILRILDIMDVKNSLEAWQVERGLEDIVKFELSQDTDLGILRLHDAGLLEEIYDEEIVSIKRDIEGEYEEYDDLDESAEPFTEKYLYHATPSYNLPFVKEKGIGFQVQERLWDYGKGEVKHYKELKNGVFLANNKYDAYGFVESSEMFWRNQAEREKQGEDVFIALLRIPMSALDKSKLELDKNHNNDGPDKSYYYADSIPTEHIDVIELEDEEGDDISESFIHQTEEQSEGGMVRFMPVFELLKFKIQEWYDKGWYESSQYEDDYGNKEHYVTIDNYDMVKIPSDSPLRKAYNNIVMWLGGINPNDEELEHSVDFYFFINPEGKIDNPDERITLNFLSDEPEYRLSEKNMRRFFESEEMDENVYSYEQFTSDLLTTINNYEKIWQDRKARNQLKESFVHQTEEKTEEDVKNEVDGYSDPWSFFDSLKKWLVAQNIPMAERLSRRGWSVSHHPQTDIAECGRPTFWMADDKAWYMLEMQNFFDARHFKLNGDWEYQVDVRLTIGLLSKRGNGRFIGTAYGFGAELDNQELVGFEVKYEMEFNRFDEVKQKQESNQSIQGRFVIRPDRVKGFKILDGSRSVDWNKSLYFDFSIGSFALLTKIIQKLVLCSQEKFEENILRNLERFLKPVYSEDVMDDLKFYKQFISPGGWKWSDVGWKENFSKNRPREHSSWYSMYVDNQKLEMAYLTKMMNESFVHQTEEKTEEGLKSFFNVDLLCEMYTPEYARRIFFAKHPQWKSKIEKIEADIKDPRWVYDANASEKENCHRFFMKWKSYMDFAKKEFEPQMKHIGLFIWMTDFDEFSDFDFETEEKLREHLITGNWGKGLFSEEYKGVFSDARDKMSFNYPICDVKNFKDDLTKKCLEFMNNKFGWYPDIDSFREEWLHINDCGCYTNLDWIEWLYNLHYLNTMIDCGIRS